MTDLRVMMKVSGKPVAKKPIVGNQGLLDSSSDVRIEDGRLWYDKKWLVPFYSFLLKCECFLFIENLLKCT